MNGPRRASSETMTIQQVSRLTGLSVTTLRYYEEIAHWRARQARDRAAAEALDEQAAKGGLDASDQTRTTHVSRTSHRSPDLLLDHERARLATMPRAYAAGSPPAAPSDGATRLHRRCSTAELPIRRSILSERH